MKLKFDANLPYQQEVIQAAVGVFEGQPSNQSQFEVRFTTQMDMLEQTELDIGGKGERVNPHIASGPGRSRMLDNGFWTRQRGLSQAALLVFFQGLEF